MASTMRRLAAVAALGAVPGSRHYCVLRACVRDVAGNPPAQGNGTWSMRSAREVYRDDLSAYRDFPRMSFSSHASSTEPVTLEEVERISAPTLDESRRLAGRLLWGPIPANIAKDAGAAFPTASVLLQPHVTPELRAALMREIPADVLPQPGDTAPILARRLAGSTFLEDSHVLKGGRGPQRVRLNATTYKQPRRRSWSVLVK